MSLSLAKTMKRLHGIRPRFLIVSKHSFASCPKAAGDACAPSKRLKKDKPKSMWFNPKCCTTPCKDSLPRYDELYYKPSDKHRDYKQTWVECPKLRLVPKQLCCYEKIDTLPMERRSRKPKSCDNFEFGIGEKLERMCMMKSNDKCAKIRLPGCEAVRDPPRCFELRKPRDCKKVKAPFPSYSECDHPKRKVRPPTECGCLQIRPFCATEIGKK